MFIPPVQLHNKYTYTIFNENIIHCIKLCLYFLCHVATDSSPRKILLQNNIKITESVVNSKLATSSKKKTNLISQNESKRKSHSI